jgi:tetratricopeptide (TPR) repeat protein
MILKYGRIILISVFFCVLPCVCHAYDTSGPEPDYAFGQRTLESFSSGLLEQYYIDLALQEFEALNYDAALKNLNIAISLNKNNPIPWQYIGIIYFNKAMYEDAMQMLMKSLEIYQDSFAANSYAGLIHEMWNDKERALYYYKEAVRVDPCNKEGYLKLFEHYRKNLMYSSIIKYGKSAVALNLPPETASYIYLWVGYAYIYIGDYDLAVDNLYSSRKFKKPETPDYFWLTGLANTLKARKAFMGIKDKETLGEMDKVLLQVTKKNN